MSTNAAVRLVLNGEEALPFTMRLKPLPDPRQSRLAAEGSPFSHNDW
jgi:hypothetical protein